MSVFFVLQAIPGWAGPFAKAAGHPHRDSHCPFETYRATPMPHTMDDVAFPESIFNAWAADLPRRACRIGESITMSSKARMWVGFRAAVPGIALIFLVTATGAGTALAATTHYIAANGSDSNNGTTNTTSWQHAPGMPNCSASCASYTPQPGDKFIFRGGDTWHFGNSSASPSTGGTMGWGVQGWSGSSGNPIYVGVDQTWYTGGSWTRPIFDGDNALCNANTLGANCFKGAFGAGGIYYTNSCAYQVADAARGSNWQNVVLELSGTAYITVDNLEFRGLCAGPTAGNDGQNSDAYLTFSSTNNMTFEHLYIHGWSHVKFNPNCSGSQFPCLNLSAFKGGYGVSGSTPGNNYLYNVVDGADADPDGAGVCYYCDWYNTAYNYFGNITEGTPISPHVFHDNVMEYWYDPGDAASHGNVFESHSEYQGINVFYDNVIRHIAPDFHTQVGFWPQPCAKTGTIGLDCNGSFATTDYFFNNIVYDADGSLTGNYFNIGQNANSGSQGPIVIFNNTWQVNDHNSNGTILQCNSTQIHPFTAANNHYVALGASPYSSPCSGGTFFTEIAMTNQTATTDGYTQSETYALSPTSANSPTVGAGTSEQSYCSTLSTSTDPLVQAAGTACQSDTTYACGYNSDHTLTCPARTPNARGGNWDVGAYEYSSQGQPPNPPTGLTAVVN